MTADALESACLDYLSRLNVPLSDQTKTDIRKAAELTAGKPAPERDSKRRYDIFALLYAAGFEIALCSILATVSALSDHQP